MARLPSRWRTSWESANARFGVGWGVWRRRGDAGLETRPRSGRPSKLTDAQTVEILKWLRASPLNLGFSTDLWTAARVTELIEQRFGVRMNHRYVSDWLMRRGITPQMPERRPRERDEKAVGAWIAREWPAIKKK